MPRDALLIVCGHVHTTVEVSGSCDETLCGLQSQKQPHF